MKIVLEVKTIDEALRNNDIIVYKNGGWTAISKESFFAKQKEVNKSLDERLSKLEKDLVNLAKIVKEK